MSTDTSKHRRSLLDSLNCLVSLLVPVDKSYEAKHCADDAGNQAHEPLSADLEVEENNYSEGDPPRETSVIIIVLAVEGALRGYFHC